MTLVKFNNGHRNAVNPFFSDVFQSLLNDTQVSDRFVTKTPAVNIAETENQFEIELAAPGLSKEDFKISIDKNVLSVSAEKKTENVEEGKKYSKKEYAYNSFVRSFTLPESADQSKIEAEYINGILTLKVSKKEEAKVQSREIAVK
ncbi:Hsp20/alpha crystallin family protein [Mucilaginibacter agri]|uniref:Hsp20 family protein n=1 Tax=Mucilaginibacter agri TaxID=2695265 RepID=A0A965ZIN7_9SPHI|nr:Hsp20/alpha crystallin family protein [Mucilaginibacter agri]NCD71790.1 Hsp20 family protein [Mucilaginibacter agri]